MQALTLRHGQKGTGKRFPMRASQREGNAQLQRSVPLGCVRYWRDRNEASAPTIGDPLGTSGPAVATRHLAPPLVLFARVKMSLMSAAHSGKFSKTDFKKTGFAAAGPEPSASESS
jgi:hypothetical protein